MHSLFFQPPKGEKRSENKSVLKTVFSITYATHHRTQNNRVTTPCLQPQKLSQAFLPSNLPLCDALYQFQPARGSCAFYVNLRKAAFILLFRVPGLAHILSLSPGICFFSHFQYIHACRLAWTLGVGDLPNPPARSPRVDSAAGSWHTEVVLSSPSSTTQ